MVCGAAMEPHWAANIEDATNTETIPNAVFLENNEGFFTLALALQPRLNITS
jgi:hypothetical protein